MLFSASNQYAEESTFRKNSEWLFVAALLYLLIPSAFVLIYFAPWPAAVAIAVGLAILWNTTHIQDAPKPLWASFRNTWPFLILAAGAVWLSGVLPPFAENSDWHKHYALFNTLANFPWPPKIVTEEGVATLRYSLSYYVFPAVVAKYFGLWVLPIAIFVWTTLGLYIAMLLAFFGGIARPASVFFLLGCIFLLFSGADILGTYYTGVSFGPVMHFEWWWWRLGALDSTLTSLFWVPQHAIAGWIAAFLMLQYPRRSLQNAGIIAAAASVWSPFVALGLIPILVWAVFNVGYRVFFTRINFVAAPVLLVSAALFLTKGSSEIPAHVMWSFPAFTVGGWLVFVFLEFGAIALALMLVSPHATLLITLQCVFLLALALFNVGATNDLLMRASIPSLGILAVLSAQAVNYAPNTLRKAPLIVCLLLGLATPLGEIMRLSLPSSSRILNASEITIQDVVRGGKYLPQYITYENADNAIKTAGVLHLSDLHFSEFGVARFDKNTHQVASDIFTDAALVSDDIALPAGIYKLDAVFDWNVASENTGQNGGHLSLHGDHILIPIMSSRSLDAHASSYFRVSEKPFKLSFGLGGWSTGKGFVRLKQLKIGLVKKADDE